MRFKGVDLEDVDTLPFAEGFSSVSTHCRNPFFFFFFFLSFAKTCCTSVDCVIGLWRGNEGGKSSDVPVFSSRCGI